MAEAEPVMETIPTEFDYFESKAIQAAVIDEYDHYVIAPPVQDGNPIEFEISSGHNLYRDLNNSKLEVKCKIVAADGTDIGDDVAVGPVNMMLHSMFNAVDMHLCDKKITSINTLYPYRAYMETLLSYGKDVGKTRLLAEGWIRDTPGNLDDFVITDAGHNVGFKTRRALFRGSRMVPLIGRPHLDLFHQNLDIPPGCKMRLKFYPSPPNFFLKKPAALADNFKLRILSARLWVRTKMVSPNFLLAQETMLRKHNFRIPFNMVEMKTASITQGLTSIELDNIFTGTMPERVVIGLLSDACVNGASGANPFHFHHFDLCHVALLVNHVQFPRQAYEPNFTTGDYIREYYGLLEGIGLDTGNKAIDLTPEEWASSLPLFIFRLNPCGLPSLPQVGAARLVLKFRTPTPNVITVMIFSEVPTIAEIDQYRNLILA